MDALRHIKTNSMLNVIERELEDLSQNLDGDPSTVSQRFDDLLTLVKSAKAVLNDVEMCRSLK